MEVPCVVIRPDEGASGDDSQFAGREDVERPGHQRRGVIVASMGCVGCGVQQLNHVPATFVAEVADGNPLTRRR